MHELLQNARKRCATGLLAFSTGLACLPGAGAGQASAELKVMVTGASLAGTQVFCRSEVSPAGSGATVTVVCSTGAIASLSAPGRFTRAHGGAYQYSLQIRHSERISLDGDSQPVADSGAVWRIVKLGNQEYLELTLAW